MIFDAVQVFLGAEQDGVFENRQRGQTLLPDSIGREPFENRAGLYHVAISIFIEAVQSARNCYGRCREHSLQTVPIDDLASPEFVARKDAGIPHDVEVIPE
jgi:hypothetical protein